MGTGPPSLDPPLCIYIYIYIYIVKKVKMIMEKKVVENWFPTHTACGDQLEWFGKLKSRHSTMTSYSNCYVKLNILTFTCL